MDFEKRLTEIAGAANVKLEEPMKNHTTFRIGGPARYFVTPENADALILVIGLCRGEEKPFAVIGNGSNLLVSDQGYQGVVISTEKLDHCQVEGNQIRAGAGVKLARMAKQALEHGLAGLEFAAGIPGTVGGALVMNAGAYGSEICNVLSRAKVMTTEGEILELPAEELELGYRTSCIPKKNYIVLEAVFELTKGSKEAISSQMRELAGKRREKQPLEYPSAGSTFKRPEGYFAAKLIEDAGLKGFSVGGAMVSEKHSGFVINYNDATASDVMELCRQVREKVKALSGVELEMEVKRLGEFK